MLHENQPLLQLSSLPAIPLPPPRPLLSRLAAGTSIALIGLSQVVPATVVATGAPILAAVLITAVGIPHGASDHLIHAAHVPHRTAKDSALFYTGYIGLLFLHVAAWWVNAPTAFAFFLTVSAYHFGQGEFEYLHGRDPIAWLSQEDGDHVNEQHRRRVLTPTTVLLYASRGALIISLIAFAQPVLTEPVIAAVTGLPIALPTLLCRLLVGAAIAQHAAVLAFGLPRTRRAAEFARHHAAKCTLLVVLFTRVHAYAAFAVYFGLWHAREFDASVVAAAVPATAWRDRATHVVFAAPIVLAVPVVAVVMATTGSGRMGQVSVEWVLEAAKVVDAVVLWRAFLVVVSVITTPHVVYLQGWVRVRGHIGSSSALDQQHHCQLQREKHCQLDSVIGGGASA